MNFHELLSLLFRMAALFLKRLTFQTIRTETSCTARCLGERVGQKTSPAPPHPVASAPRPSCLIHAKAFSTEDTQEERKKKKKDETAFSNIGRKIHERIIHVLDEQGNDLGHMHRANVIRLMAERDLRLVRRDPGAEPPQYQLLTGAQIHQERLRLREAGRAEPKPGRCPAVCPRAPQGHVPTAYLAFAEAPCDNGAVENWGGRSVTLVPVSFFFFFFWSFCPL